MSRYIIILSTIVNTPIDLNHINQTVSVFTGVLEWSVDLEDCDKILRVVCGQDISADLVRELGKLEVSARVLEIFDEQGRSLVNYAYSSIPSQGF